MKSFYTTVLFLIPIMGFSQSITDGLLLHYKLNGNAIDETPNGFDGTPSGVTSVNDANGNPNSAYFFDGVNDYIDLPNAAALKPSIPFSYSYMVKFEHLNLVGNQMFTSDFQENNYHGSWTTLSADRSGRIVLSFGGGLGNTGSNNRRSKLSNETVVTQKWYRLTFVVRGAADMDIYIDCMDAGGTYTGTGATDIVYSNVPGSIGRTDAHTALTPYYFEGTMDDFAFWNRALTESEVISLCSNILSVEDGGIITDNQVSTYPNPFNQSTTFSFVNSDAKTYVLRLFDAAGREVKRTEAVNSKVIVLDREGLGNGIYFYQVTNVDEQAVIGFGKVIVSD